MRAMELRRGVGLRWVAAAAATACLAVTGPGGVRQLRDRIDPVHAYIVEGGDVAALGAAVRSVGGQVTHELPIISSVAARLTVSQATALGRAHRGVALFADGDVKVAGTTTSQTGRETVPDIGMVDGA